MCFGKIKRVKIRTSLVVLSAARAKKCRLHLLALPHHRSGRRHQFSVAIFFRDNGDISRRICGGGSGSSGGSLRESRHRGVAVRGSDGDIATTRLRVLPKKRRGKPYG
jgi:hypothetical protein